MKKWFLSVILVLSLFGAVYAQDTPTTDPTIEAIIAAVEPEVIQSYPLENHTATITLYRCAVIDGQPMSYERLDITNDETNETHMVAEQMYQCGSGLGAYGLSILHATTDSAYLFYTDGREGSPDGLPLAWVPPLLRVNLADFSIEPLGQAKFSLTRQWLVLWDQTQIRFMAADGDLAEATEPVSLPADLNLTDVDWLPGDTDVIYVQSDFFMGGSRNTVSVVNRETMEQTIVFDTSVE